ncbi:MAG: metallophosphoesterase family protein [Planctomycetaceae bacterium]|nr:metallophosphoesterase family protein [Planctomycetaceae bacterium]
MKILLLADIHANSVALSAIRESFDACLCLGDIVEYGTDAATCIDWVRHHAHAAVRGNHDHSTAQRVPMPQGTGFRMLAAATRALHWETLMPAHIKFLARLPVTQTLQLDGRTFHLVHATPRDPLDEYLTNDPKAWSSRLKDVEADYVCVGHTHVPMHLELARCQVINPGSVGQPRDGDPRAAYAVIENGRLEFRRVEYDIDRAIQQMQDAGLNGEALDIAADTLRSGGRSPALTKTL